MGSSITRKLAGNFFALGIAQAAAYLLPLAVLPHVVSVVGIKGFGEIAVAQVVMLFISGFVDYGLNLTATRDIALATGDRKRLSQIFVTTLATRFVLSLAGFLLLLVLVFGLPFFRERSTLYLTAYVYVLGQAFIPNWFFQGLEKMRYISYIALGSRILFATGVIVFIRQSSDGIYFLLLFGLSNLVTGIVSCTLAFGYFRLQWFRIAAANIIEQLRWGWQLTLGNLSINACQYSNILVLRWFTSDPVAGYYAIAEKIYLSVKQILSIYSQSIYPELCRLAQNSSSDLREFLRKYFIPFFAAIAMLCLALFVFAPHVVYLFTREHGVESVLLLRILSVVPLIICLNIPAYLALVAGNHKSVYLRVFSVATILNISANICLAYLWGPTGTAMSVIITELFISIALNLAFFRTIQLRLHEQP